MASGEEEVALRLAKALQALGFFVGQQGLDNASIVMAVLRGAGVASVLDVRYIDRSHEYYVVEVNRRGCRTKCVYEGGCQRSDEECINRCVEDCTARLLEKIVEALERYASRRRGRSGTG